MKQHPFTYDLSLDMNPALGKLVFFEDGTLICEENGESLFSISVNDFKELKVQPGVGCGLIYAASEDSSGDCVLCRFSMSGLKLAGEFCKVVNYYKLTGKAAMPDEKEDLVCENCGRARIAEINVCVFCYNKLSVMKRAFGFLRPYAFTITTTQLINALSLLAFLATPLLTRFLIDAYLYPQLGTWGQILVITGAMLFVRALSEVMAILSQRRFNKATISVFNDMRVESYGKLQSHSMSLFAKRTPGDLIRRIMEDTETVGEFLTDWGRWVLEMIFMFVIAIVILFFTSLATF